jgi:hypothetical protein
MSSQDKNGGEIKIEVSRNGITSNDLPVSDQAARLSSFPRQYNDYLQDTVTRPESKPSQHKTQGLETVQSKPEFNITSK